MNKRRSSRRVGLSVMLVMVAAFTVLYSANGFALVTTNCAGIGGSEVSGNCTLDGASYVCTDDTQINVTGDFTITGTGSIACDGVTNQAAFDLAIDVGGSMTVDGEISANGGNGSAGGTGAIGAIGQPAGTIDINAAGSMAVNGLVAASGGAGGAGGAGGIGGNGGAGNVGGQGGGISISAGGSFLLSSNGLMIADGGAGGSGGPGGAGGGNGNSGANAAIGGTIDILSCETTINGILTAAGGSGGSGGAGGSGGGDGGNNGSGGNGGAVALESGRDLTLGATAFITVEGGDEGSIGNGSPSGTDVANGGNGGSLTTNRCSGFSLIDSATVDLSGGIEDGVTGSRSDLSNGPCCPCQIVITKSVALDENCDGSADGPFLESVIQEPGQCVIYEICVENTATNGINFPQELLDILVNDSNLGISLAPFGDLAPGAQLCQYVTSDITASECTADPDACECTEVQGQNTAVVGSAQCAATGGDACQESGSVCDDNANVACKGCSVDIQKTVALDNDCDGVADGPFVDSVVQDEGECVVYKVCVANTGDQDLDASGVEVNDATLGVVNLDFGTIAAGADPVCKVIPVDASASTCTTYTDPASCECTEVEGTNTAEITAAVCTDTGANACSFAESNCDDTAEVACVDCSVDIEKKVALDEDCDGTADSAFADSVTQDEGQCVIYQICVTNTGEQNLNTTGVEVSDQFLGVVDLNFGTLIPDETQCREIPADVAASACTTDPDSCECTEVEGTNTATVTSAVCEQTGSNACDFGGSDCDDTAAVDCLTCSVDIEKTVALDDNCDGVADGPFENSVSQGTGECVVYQICVTNTGEQELDASGVEVSDSTLGVVDLDFGVIAAGADPVCKTIPVDASASACTADPDSCVCEEVEGTNTAAVSAAICSETGENACDFAASDCDDTAAVDCLTCSVDIDKTVALDDNCDGIADSAFTDSVTQATGQCVVYKICVANTGEQELDATGVVVNDATLGVVSLNFGTIAAGADPVCKTIPVDASASACTADPDSCVCEEVQGTNTATITSAICADSDDNACDSAASDCDDTAQVECAGEGCLTHTPGYWGTHPKETREFLPVTSCGYLVDTFGEAVQDLCGNAFDASNNGIPRQEGSLIRQCTAAMLNLSATAFFGGDCGSTLSIDGELLDRIRYCCEELCTSGATGKQISESGCIEDLDRFNNWAGSTDPLDSMELCPNEQLGTEPPCAASSGQCSAANGDGIINPR